MKKPSKKLLEYGFITAIATPVTDDERLHAEGLEIELHDQWSAGINGVLVGGTMGLMQMLSDQTYRDLVRRAVEFSRGRGEVMAGAGDTSFARTRDRIRFLNTLDIDAVVVLSPFFLPFTQRELIDYFRALADESRKPLYLYDLPQVVRTKIDVDTVLELSRHPNIKGIKCSDYAAHARPIQDAIGDRFRVVVAAPDLIDAFLKVGIKWHLDGVFSLAPRWVTAIGKSAQAGKWDAAARYQGKMYALVRLLRKYGVFPTFTVLMNARGNPASFCLRPYRQLDSKLKAQVLRDPLARELIRTQPTAK
jgi:4-hydroxy-tetrahydrodipicolinate synthase